MSKPLKILGLVIFLVIILGLFLWGIWYWFSHQALPQTDGTIQVIDLSQPVEVIRDEYGVAHIYAGNTNDLFFTQGYVHAQERFWQMEFQRRLGAGRLSEYFGESTLETDIYIRHFGFQDLARQAYELADPEIQTIIDAYTAGVNSYISGRIPAQLGLEFAFLGVQGVDVEIEPWSPDDSLIWGEMLMFDQSDQLRTELTNIKLLASVGEDMYNDLRPAYRQDRPVIISAEESGGNSQLRKSDGAVLTENEFNYLLEISEFALGEGLLPPLLADLGFNISGGSNSFVVSGENTTTGKPLLADDPHMSVNMPALWYEVGMHCVQISDDCIHNFRGFSLPGVPGILIGHNDRIAWGLTNAAFDAEDVFIERINPQNPDQYEADGEWVDMKIRPEEIEVNGQDDPVVVFVRSTRNGVVASDGMVNQSPFSYGAEGLQLFALSYAWTALEPALSVQAVLKVNAAQNWEEFENALFYFDAGKQNWLYADVDGNIGYIMPGKVPIRAGGDGSLPVPGWNDDYRWTGYIPFDELPRLYNPEKGFIATANNPQLRDGDYPYLINASQDRGQRAQRATDKLLNDPDGISIEDMVAIQTDNMSLSALEIIPYLRGITFDDPDVSSARERLLDWDTQMYMDSSDAALFNIFWTQLIAGTFHDQLPEDLYPNGNHITSDTIYFLLQEQNDVWWDDIKTSDIIEDRDIILKKAFTQAYFETVELLGGSYSDWRWGDLHTITFKNATLGNSGIGAIESIFNRGPFATSGSESVIQKTCWSTNLPYQVICIPALRQVVDLGELGNSLMIHSVGQSGHPVDPHYDDFIDPWRTFEYHPSNWDRLDSEAGEHSVLLLEPVP